jgi:D-alanyl-D-alanine carboxypeptidase
VSHRLGREFGAAAAAAALACVVAACGGGESAATTAVGTTEAATTTAAAVAAAGVVNPAAAAALQSALEEFAADWVPAGVSAAVLWPDGAFWEGAAGLADAPAGRLLGADDPMVIGSTTKSFTATVVMQLVEEGLLGLDDPVAPYFPDWGLNEALTVRHLLGHHSGLWNYTTDALFGQVEERLDPAQVVRDAAARGELFAPGAHFHYSNTNYTLLGLLIGEVTGRSAHDAIRARILDPFGLEDTFMAWYEERLVTVPPAGGDPATPALTGLGTGAYTAGALASTPADLVRFGAALFGGDLVSPETLALMVTPGEAGGEGATYGLGVEILEVAGHTVWGHRGGMPGYQSALFYLPESGVIVALCANSTEPGFPELRETLVALVAAG